MPTMFECCHSQLHGTQLIWIDQPPAPLERRRVMVVIEDLPFSPAQPANDRLQNFLQARGCMGQASREQVLNDLAVLREDWARNPLGNAQVK